MGFFSVETLPESKAVSKGVSQRKFRFPKQEELVGLKYRSVSNALFIKFVIANEIYKIVEIDSIEKTADLHDGGPVQPSFKRMFEIIEIISILPSQSIRLYTPA